MSTRQVPDAPLSFGYKSAWIAARAAGAEALAAALRLEDARPSTWAMVLERALGAEHTDAREVFVTPPVRGWSLAVGVWLPEPSGEPSADRLTPMLLALGREFDDVQYFGTHRVVEWHAWARVVGGRSTRRFSYVGDRGEVVVDDGEPTQEERELGLAFTRAQLEGEGPWPDEESVVALAGRWSVNPTTLEELGLPASLGVLGRLPG